MAVKVFPSEFMTIMLGRHVLDGTKEQEPRSQSIQLQMPVALMESSPPPPDGAPPDGAPPPPPTEGAATAAAAAAAAAGAAVVG